MSSLFLRHLVVTFGLFTALTVPALALAKEAPATSTATTTAEPPPKGDIVLSGSDGEHGATIDPNG